MAMFSKRHYEAIANAMQGSLPDQGGMFDAKTLDQWQNDCGALAAVFERDNSQFDRGRFIRACQPGANVRAKGGK